MSRSNFETDVATSAKLLVVHGLQHAETRVQHDDFWTEVERRMDARRESMGFLPAIQGDIFALQALAANGECWDAQAGSMRSSCE